MSSIIVIPAVAIITLLLGFAGGIWYRKRHYEEKLDQATQTAAGILAQARKEADAEKKEVRIELTTLDDIYKCSDQLLAIADTYN